MALERDVMLGAYTVRKLIEARTKVPHSVRDQQVMVDVVPAIVHHDGATADLMNWTHIERWFDFAKRRPGTLTVRQFCNQVVHSWFFLPVFDEVTRCLTSILVSSDWDRAHSLYVVATDSLVSVFRSVGEHEPSALILTRGVGESQWKVDVQ
jgi:hypothetical protein